MSPRKEPVGANSNTEVTDGTTVAVSTESFPQCERLSKHSILYVHLHSPTIVTVIVSSSFWLW